MPNQKNPFENIPELEIVPITRTPEKGKLTNIDVINGGLKIINDKIRDKGDDEEDIPFSDHPHLNS
jgi:hypothetical protein